MRTSLGLAAILILVSGCQKSADAIAADVEPSSSRTVAVSGTVHAVDVRGPDTVTITHGPALKVSATGPRSLLDKLDVHVQAARLVIDRRGESLSNRGLRIAVTLPGIDAIALAGSGDVSLDRGDGPDFVATLDGSGDLKIASLAVSTAAFDLQGSGDITASGKAATLRVGAAGSGAAELGALVSDQATVSASGSGDVELGATRRVTGAASGSGDVTIAGHPACTMAKTGSGEVSCGG